MFVLALPSRASALALLGCCLPSPPPHQHAHPLLLTALQNSIKPLEEAYQFGEFYSPVMRDSDFDALPLVLLLGQYR